MLMTMPGDNAARAIAPLLPSVFQRAIVDIYDDKENSQYLLMKESSTAVFLRVGNQINDGLFVDVLNMGPFPVMKRSFNHIYLHSVDWFCVSTVLLVRLIV